MKLRKTFFIISFLIFIFCIFGVAGNSDKNIDTPVIYILIEIVSGITSLVLAKYLESRGEL